MKRHDLLQAMPLSGFILISKYRFVQHIIQGRNKNICRRKLMERTSRSGVGAAHVDRELVGKVVERAEADY